MVFYSDYSCSFIYVFQIHLNMIVAVVQSYMLLQALIQVLFTYLEPWGKSGQLPDWQDIAEVANLPKLIVYAWASKRQHMLVIRLTGGVYVHTIRLQLQPLGGILELGLALWHYRHALTQSSSPKPRGSKHLRDEYLAQTTSITLRLQIAQSRSYLYTFGPRVGHIYIL